MGVSESETSLDKEGHHMTWHPRCQEVLVSVWVKVCVAKQCHTDISGEQHLIICPFWWSEGIHWHCLVFFFPQALKLTQDLKENKTKTLCQMQLSASGQRYRLQLITFVNPAFTFLMKPRLLMSPRTWVDKTPLAGIELMLKYAKSSTDGMVKHRLGDYVGTATILFQITLCSLSIISLSICIWCSNTLMGCKRLLVFFVRVHPSPISQKVLVFYCFFSPYTIKQYFNCSFSLFTCWILMNMKCRIIYAQRKAGSILA